MMRGAGLAGAVPGFEVVRGATLSADLEEPGLGCLAEMFLSGVQQSQLA